MSYFANKISGKQLEEHINKNICAKQFLELHFITLILQELFILPTECSIQNTDSCTKMSPKTVKKFSEGYRLKVVLSILILYLSLKF